MAYKQLVSFDIKKMGTKPGYCLQNVRLGFGVPSKHYDAKEDMEANKAAGTLHDISTLPTNVAVPVYLDTSSPYEHIIVSDHGTLYSDGKRLTSLNGFKVFGWGESVNGVRVVEKVPEPAKLLNEQVADQVIAGKWGNAPERYTALEKAGYDPKVIQDIVNQKLKGGSSAAQPASISVGSKVTLINWVDYTGKALKKTRSFYFVSQISGDRVVLTADSVQGPIYAAVKKSNLRIV